MLEIALAVLGIIISTAITENQIKKANAKAARQTDIRRMYAAIQNRYGITVNQLETYLSKLGIQLDRLTESARGSARLADATQKMLKLQKEYPQIVSKISTAKDNIQKEADKLANEAESKAALIDKGGVVSNSQVNNTLTNSVKEVNDILSDSGVPLKDDGDNDLLVGDKEIPQSNTKDSDSHTLLPWEQGTL